VALHTVTLWVDSLFDADGEVLGDWQDPCPSGCSLAVACVENADTPVTFNLTVMRAARQGFFDVAVNFDTVFCSAKVDCRKDGGDPLELLFRNGVRDTTVVTALACTAGPGGAGPTELFRNLLVITCADGSSVALDPALPEGNAWVSDPDPADAVWQYAVHAGTEALPCGNGSCNKLFWNVAFGLDTDLDDCVLTTRMSAGRLGSLEDLTTPADSTWPFIDVLLTLTDGAGLVCDQHPLGGLDGAVETDDTRVDAPETFDFGFDGVGFTTSTFGGVVVDGLRLLIDPSRPDSVTAGSATAYDLSGNDFHGTFRNPNGVATNLGDMDANLRLDTTDTPPGALDFVGTGNVSQGYLQFAAHPLGGFGTYAVEAWFKVPSATPVAIYNVIFYSSAPDTSFQEFGLMAQAAVGDADLAVEIDNLYTDGTSNVRLGLDWSHLVFTYDGDRGYLYLDGSLVYERDFANGNVLPTTGWNWIGVGQWANSGYNGGHGYTQGKLGYLALYGRHLLAADVMQNFEALRDRFGL
jgi:hypothetical protein